MRWVQLESIHLTLKFLGELDPAQIQAVIDVCRGCVEGLTPFELQAAGLGVFPQPSRPRVVWVGLQTSGKVLSDLQSSLESGLAQAGFGAEERPFHAHLTLGRTRRDLSRTQEQALADHLRGEEVGVIGKWRVEEIALMRSDLRPEGAVYTPVETFRLVRGEQP
jgi:2'-5' RNA ligase